MKIILFITFWAVTIWLFSQGWYLELIGTVISIFVFASIVGIIIQKYKNTTEDNKSNEIQSSINSGDYKTAYIKMHSMAMDNPYRHGHYMLIMKLKKLSKLGYEPAQMDVCKYYVDGDDNEQRKAVAILNELVNKGNKEASEALARYKRGY